MGNNYRFDHRSKEEFSKDIKRATLIENWLMDLWVKEMVLRGNKIDYFDNGVDNSGEFVDIPNSSSDYKIIENGETKFIEVKTSPIGNDKKSSFKVDALQACIRNKAEILVFYNIATRSTNFKLDTIISDIYWYRISVPTQRKLLEWYEPVSIAKIMGGKKIIMVPAEHYQEVFGTKQYFTNEFGVV